MCSSEILPKVFRKHIEGPELVSKRGRSHSSNHDLAMLFYELFKADPLGFVCYASVVAICCLSA